MRARKAQAEDFDLDSLRLDPAKVAPAPATTAHPVAAGPAKRNRDFVMVPGTWVRTLCKTKNHCAYRLALHLLQQDWKKDGRQLRLANEGVEADLGLSRWQKYTALRELEKLGLVTVDRRFKKSPLVKVRRD